MGMGRLLTVSCSGRGTASLSSNKNETGPWAGPVALWLLPLPCTTGHEPTMCQIWKKAVTNNQLSPYGTDGDAEGQRGQGTHPQAHGE